MRFPRLADFQVSAHASEIFCYPFSDLPEETIRHLLIDQVLPRCLAHRGRIMVHASAVRIDDGAILFLGDSGSGKSTLAANFHQAGQRALSDDCIWMREHGRAVEVVPSYGGVRLWEDSLDVLFPSQATEPMAHYSAKKRISLETENSPASSIWLKVLALFVLAVPNPNAKPQINIQLLAKREAFIALVKQCFQLDVMDVKRVERQMDTIGRMIPFLPAFHLTIPHDYDLLPQVRQKILEAVL